MVFADLDWDGMSRFLAQVAAVLVALTPFLYYLKWRQRKDSDNSKLRDDITDDRVDQIWSASMRRGMVEAKEKKLVADSEHGPTRPVTVREDVRREFIPVAPFLRRRWRLAKKLGLTDAQFAEQLEATPLTPNYAFGDWLVSHICQRYEIKDYACLQLAVAVAKEPAPEDEPPSSDHGSDDKAKATPAGGPAAP